MTDKQKIRIAYRIAPGGAKSYLQIRSIGESWKRIELLYDEYGKDLECWVEVRPVLPRGKWTCYNRYNKKLTPGVFKRRNALNANPRDRKE